MDEDVRIGKNPEAREEGKRLPEDPVYNTLAVAVSGPRTNQRTGIRHDIKKTSSVVILVEAVHLLTTTGEQLSTDGVNYRVGRASFGRLSGSRRKRLCKLAVLQYTEMLKLHS